MSKLWKLIRLFQQSKGRSPSPSELANLKKQAEVVVEKEKIIRPDFGGSLKEFTRKEDLYEGNKKGLEKLLKSGAVKKGVAPKTKKTKDPVDPKFKRAVESQEERARLIKEFEARNKDSAFNFAFKKYKDIDRKPMEMDEVISIYTNLNKYPKGRDIIVDDIMDIQRRHILPNIGNRSRDDLVNKLNQMIRPKKQPNPFKKAPDEVTDQIEMDFTDWDPKGMKGGGIAHMLGYAEGGEVNPIALRKKLMELVTAMQTAPEEEIPMLALEARKIRKQLAKFEKEEPSIMEAAAEMQEGPMTLEERIKEKIYPKEKEVTSDATIYAPGTTTSTTGGEKVIDDQITINELARIPDYSNMVRPVRASMKRIDMDRMMSGRTQVPTKGLEALKELIRGDITEGDPRGYEKGGRVPMMYGGDPGFAFEYGGSWADWRDNHQHMMPVTEYIGTKLPKDRLPFRQELSGGGLAGLPPVTNMIGPPLPAKPKRMNPNPTPPLTDLPKHDFSQPFYQFRKRFNEGGFNKGRRNFLKLMAGLASIPVVGKFFKGAKPAAKAVEAVKASDAVGMPAWFPKLVDKVIKDGKDVTKQYGTIEREIVHVGELPSGTKVMVTQDLTTGNTAVDVGMGKHGWESGRHGQPARLELNKGEWTTNKQGKGVKTKDEFFVEEAEFTGGHPENIKYEDAVIENYGNHASDFSELELYATGKNVDKKIVGSKRAADDFAQGRAEIEAENIDEFASGGIAHMLGR